MLISILIHLIVYMIGFLSDTSFEDEIIRKYNWAYSAPNSLLVIALLIFSFLVFPVVEELFFRGFVYNALKRRVPVIVAAVIQAFIFSLFHGYGVVGSVAIFTVGIALTCVYEMRKNLLAPIFIHVFTNAAWSIPLLILAFQNFHVPASNWEQAKVRPDWVTSSIPDYVERQEDGQAQRLYTINTWGTSGSRQWKKEIIGFYAVLRWFPDDRQACAEAKLGIVTIYLYYLRDYRRAVIEADELIVNWPQQKPECAAALLDKGWAYYHLQSFQESREAFESVVSDFAGEQFLPNQESALYGLESLNFLGH
jgi:tetratricopeptide (TPR) repeat protein